MREETTDLFRSITDRLEAERLRVDRRIRTKNVEDDLRSRSVVSTSDDHSIANDEEQLPLVVVLESSERVQTVSK